MKKWSVLLLMIGMAAGVSAVETMITCEKIADEVAVSVRWSSSPSMGYRFYGRPNMIIGDWDDLSDQVATPGLFATNLPNAQFFFRAESYELPPPSSGMVMIVAGTNSGTDPDFGAYSLTVDRFWMDTTEVSKEKWDDVALWASNNGYNISTNKGAAKAAGHPVHSIRYIESVLYCNARSEMEGRTPCYTEEGVVFRTFDYVNPFTVDCGFQANGYRLPTGDEWEYAARGGLSGKRFPWGDTITHVKANYYAYYNNPAYPYDLSTVADAGPHRSYWFDGDVFPYTAPVGDLPVNGYGLFNIVGNLAEFTNPDGAITKASQQSSRGGSFNWEADKVRCGDKTMTGGWLSGDTRYGFRAVVSAP
ncbi:formylglycine-generating enzyme family protein [Pontiella sulfatireligans]|uniref:Sulfatase-modifying factor enzyme-like domain-containing protein n=1 Tax=Pontiella sulfatireligans TaxID=2750658 RepID=A0A6C2UET3_9BACT|nr:SUMF1/EgtB/PvdO family nonheme iron enzyme [Pontiella sulfatireligans]VGO18665.1 hypothetical protein SCARR_00718 [Pontiella sulfatireligans]